MMKTVKAITALSLFTALSGVATAQISPFIATQVDAAAKPCSDLAGATAGLPDDSAKAVAIAALVPCYEALQTLDAFEKSNGAGMTAEERNYFYYVGGSVIWMTAAAEAMKNNGLVNEAICLQASAAESAWGNVDVPEGTQIDIEMRTDSVRALMISACAQLQ